MSDTTWVLPEEKEHRPEVSILIPSHRPDFCAEAMASVHAQTFPDYQLIVNYQAEWYGDKINDLARIARGRYLCILPDDDLLDSSYLETCLAAARGGFDLIYTDIQFFGLRDDILQLADFSVNAFRHACVPWMTSLIRRELWDELGGFDPQQLFQDTDFYFRAALAGATAAHVREPLVWARQHAGNGAKLMDHESAALKLQGKHPTFYPSPFDGAPKPEKHDGRSVVAPVAIPRRLQRMEEYEQEEGDRRTHGNRAFLHEPLR